MLEREPISTKVPQVELPVYDNSSAVFPIVEGVQAVVKRLKGIGTEEPLDPSTVLLYRFPYRRRYATDGTLVSIPVKVWKTEEGYHFKPRKTNFLEDCGMYLSDNPIVTGLTIFLTGSTAASIVNRQLDVAILTGVATLLGVVQSGLMIRFQAHREGIATQYVNSSLISQFRGNKQSKSY